MKRFNKTNGMYALLIAVATMIGITIYGSCSSEEDYDGFSSKDELFTLADGEMNLRSEEQGTVLFQGDYIDSAGIVYKNCQSFNDQYHVNLTFQWTVGWTGNISQERSHMAILSTSVHNVDTEFEVSEIFYSEGLNHFKIVYNSYDVIGEWKPDLKLHVSLKFYGNIYKAVDHNSWIFHHYGSKLFEEIQQYEYDDLGIHIIQ